MVPDLAITHLNISLNKRHVHICTFIPVSLYGNRLCGKDHSLELQPSLLFLFILAQGCPSLHSEFCF